MTETQTLLPARADDDVLGRLQHKPIIDMIDGQTLKLIKAQIAQRCTDAEVGHFLELCAHYQLDPFAHEAWIAKGRGDDGRLLIMVGRDGLRKIAERNNRDVQCDVVREKDEYSAEFVGNRFDAKEGEWEAHGGAPFHRIVHKRQGMGTARGPIQGAWCVVTDGVTAREVGWFEAPMEEYRPTSESKLKYSPWGSQESVMILAAAERQALRQATPLSGLLAIGEDARISREDLTEGEGNGGLPRGLPLSPAVEEIIAKAVELDHPGLANRATWEMQIGRPESDLQQLVNDAWAELRDLEAHRASEPVDAVVEPDVPIDTSGLPDPPVPPSSSLLPADEIEYYDVPDKNERWYVHPGCDGVGARWVAPMDDATPPTETECAQCMSVFPVVPSSVPPEALVGVAEPDVPVATAAGGQVQGPAATNVQDTLAKLRSQRKLYEEAEAANEEEQADKDRQLNALDAKIATLEAEAGPDDTQDQGSLL